MTPTGRTALLATILLALPGTGAFAQSEATFGDWTAGCDNTRTCAAVGFTSDMLGVGWIRIERGPEAGAATSLQIILDTESKEAEISLEAKFDEPGFDTVFPSPVLAQRDSNERFVVTLSPEKQSAFLLAMRKASSLTFRRADGKKLNSDADETKFSLKGSVAALRWLDDRQRRAGNVTALIATGTAPASAVPPAPATPSVRQPRFKAESLGEKAPASIIAAWKAACDEWDEHEGMKGEGYAIAQRTQLWLMPCSRGAYNFGSMVFLMRNGQKPQLLQFEQWQRAEDRNASRFETKAEELVNAEFFQDDISIRFFSRGRGIGDCGSAGVFTWDGQRFRMTSYVLMSECRGVVEDGWLTLWRAKVVK